MNLAALIAFLLSASHLATVMGNSLAQFGPPTRRYLGAELLPERIVPQNEYTEYDIKFETEVANHATRYSPVQLKDGQFTSSMSVRLGNSDIGAEFTGQDYDTLLNYIQQTQQGGTPSMQSITQLTTWVDVRINRALIERNEVDRWKAITDAIVPIRGDGGYKEDVQLADPAGHRVPAGGAWSNPAYAIFTDISAIVTFLREKGYVISRIIAGRSVISKLLNNTDMKTRAGRVTVSNTGQIQSVAAGIMTLADINSILSTDNLPPITEYNLTYKMQGNVSGYFLKRDAMVFICETGRDGEYRDAQDVPNVIPNVLGYTGIGRPAGRQSPGRAVVLTPFENKPPRIEAEGWQTSFPVIQDPEAIGVIYGIA